MHATQQPAKDPWVEIHVEIDQRLHDALANFLIELGSNGVIAEETITDTSSGNVKEPSPVCSPISAYFKNDHQLHQKIRLLDRYLKSLTELHALHRIPERRITPVFEDDWNSQWQRYFTTTRIGRTIIVKPSWETFVPEEGDITIEINPGMAFGTGTHATTRMCLEAMETIIHDGSKTIGSMLDVGTGSGILSIAAAKLGVENVVGIDIDPVALTCARQNIANNCLEEKVIIKAVSLKKLDSCFDLVVANMLTEILMRLCNDLYSHLCKSGTLILSGILSENQSQVSQIFTSKKLSLVNTYREADWICLVFQKHA